MIILLEENSILDPVHGILKCVLLFVPLSGSFVGICSLVFSKILHGVRGPYGDVCELMMMMNCYCGMVDR